MGVGEAKCGLLDVDTRRLSGLKNGLVHRFVLVDIREFVNDADGSAFFVKKDDGIWCGWVLVGRSS